MRKRPEKQEHDENDERSPQKRSRPVRLDRVLIVSLFIHGLILCWIFIRIWVPKPTGADSTPLRWMAEVEEDDDVPTPDEFPEIDPPVPLEDVMGPAPKVVIDPLEPAPWLRPEKTPAKPALHQPEESASTRKADLSESYQPPPKKVVHSGAKTPKISQTKEPRHVPVANNSPFIGARKKPGACPRPEYPRRALRRKLGGRVTYLVDVAANGEVIGVVLEKSSGHDILDRAALAAIKKWRFTPATRGGKNVRDRVRVPTTFVFPR